MMRKLIHDYITALTSRPLVIVAMSVMAAICVLYGTGLLYNGYDSYCKNKNNVFSQKGIKDKDEITIKGIVYDISVKEYYGSERATLMLKDVYFDEQPITTRGRYVIVYTEDLKRVFIGQPVTVKGKLKYFEKATNEGAFDAYSFYKNRGVLFSLDNCVIIDRGHTYNSFKHYLYKLKLKCEEILDDSLDEQDAALVKAMILGMKSDIDTKVKESFQKSGIAHILAISGLHISFLCMTVYELLRKLRLPAAVSVTISVLFLCSYDIMVGFSASAFRASCMFIMYLFSILLKRTYDLVTAMSLAAILILLSNPGYLFDASFQLSFMAICAVGVFKKGFINNACNKTAKPGKIRGWLIESLAVSGTVFLITMPIILNCYYEIPLYGILLNLVVIPLMSVLLISSIMIIFLTCTVKEFAFIPVKITSIILWVYKYACRVLEESDLGRINLGKPEPWKVVLFYFILVFACLYKGKHKRLLLMSCVIFSLLLMSIRVPFYPRLVMLDVGQGDSFAFFNDNGNVYLYDGGSSSVKEVGEKRIIPYLKANGVNHIEGIFISHPDEDHMNGIVEILEDTVKECIDVRCVYIYAGLVDSDEYGEVQRLAKECCAKIIGISQYDVVSDGRLRIECLYPEKGVYADDINELSLVLRVQYGEFSFVETGDINDEGEKKIADEFEKVENDILKVAHHGSSTSSSEEFLDWVSPRIALISAGEDNPYGHPHKEVLEALAKRDISVLESKDMGCVTVYLDRKGIIKKITRFNE